MADVFLIAGLGNPGEEYRLTRHNAGFLVIDRICELKKITTPPEFLHGGACWRTTHKDAHLILFKPLSYMNESGGPIRRVMDAERIGVSDLIVVHDDMDIPAGRIRIKTAGGHGGHKGVASVIAHIHTHRFVRVRVGVGRRPPGISGSVYVLEPLRGEMLEKIMSGVNMAAEAVFEIIDNGPQTAMNRFHQIKEDES